MVSVAEHDHATQSGAARPIPDPLRPLARLAAGCTGADIERFVREARRTARREGRSIGWQDLVDLLGGDRSGRSHEVRWRMAVHEAGHALVQLAIGSGCITLISIETRDGGMVQIAPEPHELETQAWAMNRIAVTLAGRAAEQLVFTDPLAGSGGPPQSDLAIATDIATTLETVVGFGRHQPLLHRSMGDHSHLLALDVRLAACVNARLEECYDQATAILAGERETHLWLASELFEHGVLEGAELEAVLDQTRQRIAQKGNTSGRQAAEDRHVKRPGTVG